ncbi:MAG: hypothetical protein J6Z43_08075, partial [Clostridiales bacterium]|nr:hypothetical protein [Clostridiales bacterium]
NSDEKEVLKKIQADAQRIIMDWFIKYATDHPEVQIIYRPHPTEASNEAIKQRIDPVDNLFLIPQESIRVWMLNCDLLLNFQSTSMIEMYASGKQVRLLRPVEVPFLFEMPIFEEGKYTAITTYEAFAKSVSEEDAAFPIEAEHLLSYYDINDCPSYQRVGDFLIETLNDDSYHSRPVAKPSSDLRRFFGSRKMQMLASISESRYNRISAKENVDWEADAKAMKIKEDYVHYNYFRQKMDQNSATDDEIQTKLKRYEEIMRKGRNE